MLDFKKETIKRNWKDSARIPIAYYEKTTLIPTQRDLELFKRLDFVEKTGGMVPLARNGTNLYIWGSKPGTGKTTWATRLALSYLYRRMSKLDETGEESDGVPVVFITVNDYLMKEKESFDDPNVKEEFNKLRKDVLSCNLLIMDDLCFSERKYSDWENNSLYRIIEERLSNKRSTIYTSNRSKEEMKNLIENKVWDRIFSKSTKVLHIKSSKSKR